MKVIGDIKRILILAVGFGAALWVMGVLLGINQMAYAQYYNQDPYLQLQPTEGNTQIRFPYEITGTGLIAEALVYYDGPFLENHSEEELFNSVALLLRNTSEHGITQAEILITGNEIWFFQAKHIPPKGTVLVVESSGAKFNDTSITACTGWEKAEAGLWNVERFLHIDSVDMGTVAVTNITDTELSNIRLLYKNWLPQNDVFVGGITYEIQIDRLAAGQTVLLQPEHYAQGYNKFIRIYADEI